MQNIQKKIYTCTQAFLENAKFSKETYACKHFLEILDNDVVC